MRGKGVLQTGELKKKKRPRRRGRDVNRGERRFAPIRDQILLKFSLGCGTLSYNFSLNKQIEKGKSPFRGGGWKLSNIVEVLKREVVIEGRGGGAVRKPWRDSVAGIITLKGKKVIMFAVGPASRFL